MQIAHKTSFIPFVVRDTLTRQKVPASAVPEFDVPKDKGEYGYFHGDLGDG